MPGFDRTGPSGTGPMSGAGFSSCAGDKRPRARHSRGFGRKVVALPPSTRMFAAKDELGYLKTEVQRLEQHLQLINQRIDELRRNPE